MQTDFFQQSSKVLTVAELTRAIRGTLETKFGAVWVQGEISNYKSHPSGHQYFTLKDQRAQISCVIFRNTLPPDAPLLSEGAQVQIYGQISVFEARGQYQLSVQIVQSRGLGLLLAKFEALKRKLESEGLFDPARKRALPRYPRRLGIVTSASGAAIRDMLNVLQRRAPALKILISPVRVQGTGAATEIAVALRELARPNESWEALDLIVLTRGGGSIEDLWEFNEEIVARAIFDSPIPVVSAVGHEVDFTIADFVADLRAPTPSAAAELIVPDATDLLRRIGELSFSLERNLRNFLTHHQTRLRFLSERALARELGNRVRQSQQKLDLAKEAVSRNLNAFIQKSRATLAAQMNAILSHSPVRELAARRDRLGNLSRRFGLLSVAAVNGARQRFAHLEGLLRVLGPDGTLGRGYSITTDKSGAVLVTATATHDGMIIWTRLREGKIISQVRPTETAGKSARPEENLT